MPGFDHRLSDNFNHLMYVDKITLISKASRKASHNCEICLIIYSKLTGQNPKNNKPIVYFPRWFNRRVVKSISSILNLKICDFSFTYLGIDIVFLKLKNDSLIAYAI